MAKADSYSALVWRQFARGRLAVAGLVLIAFFVGVALFAPLIANEGSAFDVAGIKVSALIPYGPDSYDLGAILSPPSSKHWLGTDADGRDIASELVWGARVSLSVGLVAVGLAAAIGIILGMMAGYFGGIVDIVISRLIEIMICFPTFFLILAVLAFVGPSIYNIMIVIGITGWTGIARLVRAEALKVRGQDFVAAAKVSGAGSVRIMFRHILPHALTPVLVSATFGVAAAILAEAALSFLGFGVPPSVPSWGAMLSEAAQYMDVAWWLTLAPGSAIFVTIMSYNIVGEALRDAIDPNLKA
jgi:peptide/nickel transport system permease protein